MRLCRTDWVIQMDYDVIESKEWVESEGCYPSRIVLLKIKKGDRTEYSTHMQVDNGKTKYMVSGHYFIDLVSAVKDFKGREI